MSLRWRKTGEIFCAAKTKAEEGDTYIDDRLHYELSAIQKTIVPDKNEHKNGRWYWLHSDPEAHSPQPWISIQTRK